MKAPLVVATVAVLAVVVGLLLPRQSLVTGTAHPLRGDDLARSVFARCPLEGVSLDGIRYGPLVKIAGEYHAFAITPTRQLLECGLAGGSSTGGPYDRPPEVRAVLAGIRADDPYFGYGWAGQEIARLDVVLAGGGVLRTEVRNEIFVFTGNGTPPGLDVKLRAFDKTGALVYETG
jgi:hypothetical protein